MLETPFARGLSRRSETDILLAARNRAHVWKADAAHVLSGHRRPIATASPSAPHAKRNGFRSCLGDLARPDRTGRTIDLAALALPDGRNEREGQSVSYDMPIRAIESQCNDFDTSGVAEHCYFVDDLRQAEAFEEPNV